VILANITEIVDGTFARQCRCLASPLQELSPKTDPVCVVRNITVNQVHQPEVIPAGKSARPVHEILSFSPRPGDMSRQENDVQIRKSRPDLRLQNRIAAFYSRSHAQILAGISRCRPCILSDIVRILGA
jgi:hypothetical protein